MKIDPRAARASAGEDVGEVSCITEEYQLAQPITPRITLAETLEPTQAVEPIPAQEPAPLLVPTLKGKEQDLESELF